jgi:hypothetical protein
MATYTQSGSNDVAGESNARAAAAVWLTGLTPATHARDNTPFTLHALGAGFVAGSVMNVDGIDQATTVVSPGEVTASITLAPALQPHAAPVVVKAGNGYSTPAAFAIT